jgi:F-type H+-transporting ATPase subunit gamma
VLFILVASDRGLAGGFNLLQQREVEHEMAALKEKGVSSEIITCGRKPTEYFTFRKVKPVMSFVGISSEPNQDEADRIATYVMDAYIWPRPSTASCCATGTPRTASTRRRSPSSCCRSRRRSS